MRTDPYAKDSSTLIDGKTAMQETVTVRKHTNRSLSAEIKVRLESGLASECDKSSASTNASLNPLCNFPTLPENVRGKRLSCTVRDTCISVNVQRTAHQAHSGRGRAHAVRDGTVANANLAVLGRQAHNRYCVQLWASRTVLKSNRRRNILGACGSVLHSAAPRSRADLRDYVGTRAWSARCVVRGNGGNDSPASQVT